MKNFFNGFNEVIQSNFKLFHFFCKKVLHTQKSTNSIKSTKSMKRKQHKNAAFFVFVRLFAFCACKMFSLKNERAWNCLDNLIYITTELKGIFPARPKTPFAETLWLKGRHATPLVTLFFIITMLLTGRHAMPVVI